MRQARPSDVLAAVEYVTGVDPVVKRSRDRSVVAARRLACQALSEITDSSQEEAARVLLVDRSTVSHHLASSWDYRALGLVIQRVSDLLEAEAEREGVQLIERHYLGSL